SEVFLAFAGRDETAVREKAKQIYNQLKTGADFDKIAKENDKGVVTDGTGKVENLKISELSEKLATNIKGVKAGDVAEPFEADQLGMVILRVDKREKASDESVFDENAVRLAMMTERLPDEQKKFMAKLREDAYIKITETYRPMVNPILFADERKDKVGKATDKN
ncbi:MAG TPA: peptidylprolyl isomerase, partial [Pyrinomonadaceae bacterium]|nr:peptidylprolyl isomerase [Pyrinomonadaceae bacterium]